MSLKLVMINPIFTGRRHFSENVKELSRNLRHAVA